MLSTSSSEQARTGTPACVEGLSTWSHVITSPREYGHWAEHGGQLLKWAPHWVCERGERVKRNRSKDNFMINFNINPQLWYIFVWNTYNQVKRCFLWTRTSFKPVIQMWLLFRVLLVTTSLQSSFSYTPVTEMKLRSLSAAWGVLYLYRQRLSSSLCQTSIP